jgi:hypothetical protein
MGFHHAGAAGSLHDCWRLLRILRDILPNGHRVEVIFTVLEMRALAHIGSPSREPTGLVGLPITHSPLYPSPYTLTHPFYTLTSPGQVPVRHYWYANVTLSGAEYHNG